MPIAPHEFLPDTNSFVHYSRDDELARYIEQTYAIQNGAVPSIISVVILGEVRAFAQLRQWGETRR